MSQTVRKDGRGRFAREARPAVSLRLTAMRFSRAQIVGALTLLFALWLVLLYRLAFAQP